MRFWEYTYLHPWMFFLFLLIPVFIVIHLFNKRKNSPSLVSTSSSFLANYKSSWTSFLKNVPFFLRMLAYCFVIMALARPQKTLDDDTITEHSIEGIDIALSMDISTSMLALDFSPNRLEAAKKVGTEFIMNRPNDRIGLVVYEGESYTACALTTDHKALIKRFKGIKSGKIQGGTAIGMGLATAINRLRGSEAKSRVIILLTDGENNTGKIHPITAAEYAKELDIRVYTIGIGSSGKVKIPNGKHPLTGQMTYGYTEGKIDVKMLTQIAEKTGGKFYRAKNKRQLENIYEDIDKLEKSIINTIQYKKDLPEAFYGLVLMALMFLGLEFLLRHFILRFIA